MRSPKEFVEQNYRAGYITGPELLKLIKERDAEVLAWASGDPTEKISQLIVASGDPQTPIELAKFLWGLADKMIHLYPELPCDGNLAEFRSSIASCGSVIKDRT